ncbi:MAG: aminotransferase class V-fold PLP-dependent enzyme [Thermoguttaceae bacterium]
MSAPGRVSDTPQPAARLWALDPHVTMLNHGSFGACPRPVLAAQFRLRRRMEQEPVRFFMRELGPLLDRSREALAALIGAEPENLVFVRNATAGVNAVLRSLRFAPGDELLVTNHTYNACRNVAEYAAEQHGARVVVAEVPMPRFCAEQLIEAVLCRVTPRTRLAMLDHVSSPTAIIFPIEALVRELADRGVDVLVDGAHAPGMIPVNVRSLGAAYYTGNCHKWVCAPKGAGFLYVRPDRQHAIQPAVISHGFNTRRAGRSRLHDAFDWPGTDDFTPWLCVGEAIRFFERLEGGMAGQMRRNHELAVRGRETLCRALGIEPPCPAELIGSMAALFLPDDQDPATLDRSVIPTPVHRLQTRLLEQFAIEVPVYYWPAPPRRLLRISAQAYNTLGQYERLAAALKKLEGTGH